MAIVLIGSLFDPVLSRSNQMLSGDDGTLLVRLCSGDVCIRLRWSRRHQLLMHSADHSVCARRSLSIVASYKLNRDCIHCGRLLTMLSTSRREDFRSDIRDQQGDTRPWKVEEDRS